MRIFNIKKSQATFTLNVVFAVFILILVISLGILFGAEKISFNEVFSRTNKVTNIILWDIRLPRVLLAGFCGMLLSGAGCIFQGFFRNPLADSGIVGISSGATLGAVLSIFFPISLQILGINPIVLFAFAGSLGSALLVYVFSSQRRGMQGTVMMLLVGTALSSFISAIVSVILLIKYQELHKIYVWTLGSFNGRGWDEIFIIIIPALISILLLFMCVRPLDILSNGEESAQALGVDIKKTRRLTLAAGSLACACAVCVAGTIGFVGLIAPHISRRLYGSKHKNVLIFSMLWGAIILVLSDTIARTIAAPSELPVGIVTAILGVPFFIFVLQKKGFGV